MALFLEVLKPLRASLPASLPVSDRRGGTCECHIPTQRGAPQALLLRVGLLFPTRPFGHVRLSTL